MNGSKSRSAHLELWKGPEDPQQGYQFIAGGIPRYYRPGLLQQPYSLAVTIESQSDPIELPHDPVFHGDPKMPVPVVGAIAVDKRAELRVHRPPQVLMNFPQRPRSPGSCAPVQAAKVRAAAALGRKAQDALTRTMIYWTSSWEICRGDTQGARISDVPGAPGGGVSSESRQGDGDKSRRDEGWVAGMAGNRMAVI